MFKCQPYVLVAKIAVFSEISAQDSNRKNNKGMGSNTTALSIWIPEHDCLERSNVRGSTALGQLAAQSNV